MTPHAELLSDDSFRYANGQNAGRHVLPTPSTCIGLIPSTLAYIDLNHTSHRIPKPLSPLHLTHQVPDIPSSNTALAHLHKVREWLSRSQRRMLRVVDGFAGVDNFEAEAVVD